MTGHSNTGSGARSPLSATYVVATALAVIDANGLSKFSMRKLGSALDVDPMAVYRYFKDQEALYDGIAEALFAETDVQSLPWDGSWRELVEQYCRRLRDVLRAHPHAVALFANRPVRSQESIETGVRMIVHLQAAGFTPSFALQIARCLREFTIGHALSVALVHLGSQDRSKKPAPGSSAYNVLARAADEVEIDEHFDVGLTAMLNGFEQMAH